jgi:hypothetical protein
MPSKRIIISSIEIANITDLFLHHTINYIQCLNIYSSSQDPELTCEVPSFLVHGLYIATVYKISREIITYFL